MQFEVGGRTIRTDEQGFLLELEDWSEDFARALAQHLGIELFVDHWELIWYFRDYYAEAQGVPTMHRMVMELGGRAGRQFRDRKAYEKHIYRLFPSDPVRTICRLAGLPMPQPDT